MLLAEANQWPADVRAYLGMATNSTCFPLSTECPRMFMAVKLEDRKPNHRNSGATANPDTCQWCIFLRNHDELTLEMVTDIERDYMYTKYAVDKSMAH